MNRTMYLNGGFSVPEKSEWGARNVQVAYSPEAFGSKKYRP